MTDEEAQLLRELIALAIEAAAVEALAAKPKDNPHRIPWLYQQQAYAKSAQIARGVK